MARLDVRLACVWAPAGGGPICGANFCGTCARTSRSPARLSASITRRGGLRSWLTGGDAEEPALPPADTGWSPFAGRPATPLPPRCLGRPRRRPRAAAPPAARPPAARQAPPAAVAPAALPQSGCRRQTTRTQAAPAGRAGPLPPAAPTPAPARPAVAPSPPPRRHRRRPVRRRHRRRGRDLSRRCRRRHRRCRRSSGRAAHARAAAAAVRRAPRAAPQPWHSLPAGADSHDRRGRGNSSATTVRTRRSSTATIRRRPPCRCYRQLASRAAHTSHGERLAA